MTEQEYKNEWFIWFHTKLADFYNFCGNHITRIRICALGQWFWNGADYHEDMAWERYFYKV